MVVPGIASPGPVGGGGEAAQQCEPLGARLVLRNSATTAHSATYLVTSTLLGAIRVT